MTTPLKDVTSLNELVAGEVRAALGRRRWRQSHLAARLGVNEMWVSRRLRGAQPIDLDDLQRIAEALEVSVTDLIPSQRTQSTGPKVALTKARMRSPIGGPRSSDVTKCGRPIAPSQRRPERLSNPLAITTCVTAGSR